MGMISKQALLIELRKQRDDYMREHFHQDPETGTWESCLSQEDHLEDLDNRIDFIEAFPAATPPTIRRAMVGREEIARWRNDAFLQAAEIAKRYDANPYCIDDILALAKGVAPAGDGWRTDFENAPYNTAVLVCNPSAGPEPEIAILPNEHMEWRRRDATYSYLKIQPTHWRPLPAPPATPAHSEAEGEG